jgi:hypothetical protein
MKSAHSILSRIAADPHIDEGSKRGAAMLLQSLDDHCDYADRVISDDDVIARREEMEKIADLGARWTKLRDDMAAMLNKFDGDASALGCADPDMQMALAALQRAVRFSFARRYVP